MRNSSKIHKFKNMNRELHGISHNTNHQGESHPKFGYFINEITYGLRRRRSETINCSLIAHLWYSSYIELEMQNRKL